MTAPVFRIPAAAQEDDAQVPCAGAGPHSALTVDRRGAVRLCSRCQKDGYELVGPKGARR